MKKYDIIPAVTRINNIPVGDINMNKEILGKIVERYEDLLRKGVASGYLNITKNAVNKLRQIAIIYEDDVFDIDIVEILTQAYESAGVHNPNNTEILDFLIESLLEEKERQKFKEHARNVKEAIENLKNLVADVTDQRQEDQEKESFFWKDEDRKYEEINAQEIFGAIGDALKDAKEVVCVVASKDNLSVVGKAITKIAKDTGAEIKLKPDSDSKESKKTDDI